jgi:hypothetical protein
MKNLRKYTSVQKISSVLEFPRGKKSKVEIAQKIGCHLTSPPYSETPRLAK